MDEFLKGGRENIYRNQNVVYRPAEKWSKDIHQFLKYLHHNGFDKVPYPYGIDINDQEKVSYIEGEVYNDILPKEIRSDETLISFCRLVKAFHDLGEEYIKLLTGNEKWMLPICTPIETMCHGDLAPYNIVMKDNEAVGIIDFDTLHPGSRMWDIAYSLYRWIPLMSRDNPENFGSEDDKLRRLRLFIETYGLKVSDDKELFNCVVRRLEHLINYMAGEAEKGNDVFKKHIEEGHLTQYYKDLEYVKDTWIT